MDINKSILRDIREAVGPGADDSSFDAELLMHINSAISKLNQNGVGRNITVTNEDLKWNDLLDPMQEEGNKYANIIPLYVSLSTKILFDPPPPSSVEHHVNNIKEMLWRLKVAYEDAHI